MMSIVVREDEFKRAFEECLLKIQRAFTEKPDPDDRFRTVNYYVRELQRRLEIG